MVPGDTIPLQSGRSEDDSRVYTAPRTRNPKWKFRWIGKVVTLAWICSRYRRNHIHTCRWRLPVRAWWRSFPGHYRTPPATGENGCQDGAAREYRKCRESEGSPADRGCQYAGRGACVQRALRGLPQCSGTAAHGGIERHVPPAAAAIRKGRLGDRRSGRRHLLEGDTRHSAFRYAWLREHVIGYAALAGDDAGGARRQTIPRGAGGVSPLAHVGAIKRGSLISGGE